MPAGITLPEGQVAATLVRHVPDTGVCEKVGPATATSANDNAHFLNESLRGLLFMSLLLPVCAICLWLRCL